MSIPGQRTASAHQLNGSQAPIPGDMHVATKEPPIKTCQ
jgi:hypothetical protein